MLASRIPTGGHIMNEAMKWVPWRSKPNSQQLAVVESILREASRADLDTPARIATELREQTGQPRLQAEVDGVVARYWAAHPERRRGGENTRPNDLAEDRAADNGRLEYARSAPPRCLHVFSLDPIEGGAAGPVPSSRDRGRDIRSAQ